MMARGQDESYHMKFGNNAGAHVDAYLEYKRFDILFVIYLCIEVFLTLIPVLSFLCVNFCCLIVVMIELFSKFLELQSKSV